VRVIVPVTPSSSSVRLMMDIPAGRHWFKETA
jgi:hypothetical protein